MNGFEFFSVIPYSLTRSFSRSARLYHFLAKKATLRQIDLLSLLGFVTFALVMWLAELIGLLLVLYLLIEWVLPWLWYPHLGRHIHPKRLPTELQSLVNDFVETSKTEEEFLRQVMDLLKNHYHYGRFYMYFYPTRWFETDVEKIWKDTDPQLCTISNYLLEGILLNSGKFSEKDFRHRTTFTNFSLHQYIEVTLKSGKKLALDPWAYGMGAPFGKTHLGFI